MEVLIYVLVALGGLILGGAIAAVLCIILPKKKREAASQKAEKIIQDANDKSKKIVDEAESKAEKLIANAKAESKQEIEALKKEAEKDINERKGEIAEKERKLDNREGALDKREDAIITREEQIDKKRNEYEERLQALDLKDKEVQTKLDNIVVELQRIANMSIDQAREELMAKVEEKESKKIALFKEQMEEEAQSQAEDRAKTLMCVAMEKYAQDVTCEHSSSSVALPSDDMKGRIIGREGRNIKNMEQLFGVSLIIDDTPETITVSCFDPIRREKAKLTLEALIRDGRIQSARIEDLYSKISTEFDDTLKRIGEQTVFKLGLPRISSGLFPYIGRLKYRTSYGQNVLDHSIQVAYLSSVIASELGLDSVLAKRAGLLHDIGKSIDAEQEGSHVQLGSMLAKKFNEPDTVINAIESHHGDAAKRYLISEIVTAADTLSAARPGARSETLETYIKRLEQLETICKSFDGVQNSYALQSGRDVRVMVVPEKISDEDAKVMAVQIREKIESEMQYPGQIKVSVIRETRAVEIAK